MFAHQHSMSMEEDEDEANANELPVPAPGPSQPAMSAGAAATAREAARRKDFCLCSKISHIHTRAECGRPLVDGRASATADSREGTRPPQPDQRQPQPSSAAAAPPAAQHHHRDWQAGAAASAYGMPVSPERQPAAMADMQWDPDVALSAEEKAEISRQLTGYADTALELPAGDDVPLHHDCLRHAAAAASDHIMPMGDDHGFELPAGNFFFVAVDTSVFIANLSTVTDFLQRLALFVETRLLVPWRVWQELDGLKESTRDVADHDSGIAGLARAANRTVMAWLTEPDSPVKVKGESVHELRAAAQEFPELDANHGDEMILRCCLHFQRVYRDSHVILITNDHNLLARALFNGVHASLASKLPPLSLDTMGALMGQTRFRPSAAEQALSAT